MTDVVSALKILYKDRKALEQVHSKEQVREILRAELLEEYTHPRARLPLDRKYPLIKSKIENSVLSITDQTELLFYLNDEYEKLSMELDI